MILMSKYKGTHSGKNGQKIWAMPERKHFFFHEVFPYIDGVVVIRENSMTQWCCTE